MLFPPSVLGRHSLWVSVTLGLAAVLVCTALALRGMPQAEARGARAPASGDSLPAADLGRALGEIGAELGPAVAASRAVLVGAGQPAAWRRTAPDERAELYPVNAGGGPGGRLLKMAKTPPESPLALYDWLQGPLRGFLADLRGRNVAARSRLTPVRVKVRRLADRLARHRAQALPRVEARAPAHAHWPGLCLARLHAAANDRDPVAARRWAGELLAVLEALDDLHRWLELLAGNDLAAIGFQARCRVGFAWTAGMSNHDFLETMDSLPGCWLLPARIHNYFAIERLTGEWLRMEIARSATDRAEGAAPASALWMPPRLRAPFLALRTRLAPRLCPVWDVAASSPYERSYLANMIARAEKAKCLPALAGVIERFARAYPDPTPSALMDVLFYRAGAATTCVDLADRYDPRLLSTAARISGADRAALASAHGAAHRLLADDWRNYEGGPYTRKETLDQGKLDCLTGTGVLGALYGNAGRAGGCVVRVACGVTGHTLFAARTAPGQIDLADCFTDRIVPDGWPAAFHGGLAWPEGYPGRRGPAFSVELAVRGLDNYVFAEGYVIRGPHAGERVRTALPYLPGRRTAGLSTQYSGPYPAVPASRTPVEIPSSSAPPEGTSHPSPRPFVE